MFAYSLSSEDIAIPPSAEWRWDQQLQEYGVRKAKESLSVRHVQEIRRVLAGVERELSAVGLACSAARFGDRQLEHLLNGPWRPATETQSGLASATRKYNVCLLNGFLKAHGNLIVEQRKLVFPRRPVRQLIALSEDQARRLLSVSEERGIVTHSLVALEMLMGLRRSEVLRTVLAYLGESKLEVHGKARAGYKIRWLPWHDEVRRILPELLEYRRQAVEGATRDAGYLFGRRVGSEVRVWSKAHVDRRIIGPAFEAAGIRAPGNLNHALRRTFGKTLWNNGVPLPKVAALMGHEDVRTTQRYLALDDEDMAGAMQVLNRVLPARRNA